MSVSMIGLQKSVSISGRRSSRASFGRLVAGRYTIAKRRLYT